MRLGGRHLVHQFGGIDGLSLRASRVEQLRVERIGEEGGIDVGIRKQAEVEVAGGVARGVGVEIQRVGRDDVVALRPEVRARDGLVLVRVRVLGSVQEAVVVGEGGRLR